MHTRAPVSSTRLRLTIDAAAAAGSATWLRSGRSGIPAGSTRRQASVALRAISGTGSRGPSEPAARSRRPRRSRARCATSSSSTRRLPRSSLIASEALESAEVRRLMTVPGVNVICAATFLGAVGDAAGSGARGSWSPISGLTRGCASPVQSPPVAAVSPSGGRRPPAGHRPRARTGSFGSAQIGMRSFASRITARLVSHAHCSSSEGGHERLSRPVASDLRRKARAQPLLDAHADRHEVPGLAHQVPDQARDGESDRVRGGALQPPYLPDPGARGASQRRSRHAGHPQFWPTGANERRGQPAVHREEVALVDDGSWHLFEQRHGELEPLVEQAGPALEVRAEERKLALHPARCDGGHDTAAGQQVEGRELLERDERVALWHDERRDAELEALGRSGEKTERHEPLRDGPVYRRVLGRHDQVACDPAGVEAGRLCGPGRRCQPLGVECLAIVRQDHTEVQLRHGRDAIRAEAGLATRCRHQARARHGGREHRNLPPRAMTPGVRGLKVADSNPSVFRATPPLTAPLCESGQRDDWIGPTSITAPSRQMRSPRSTSTRRLPRNDPQACRVRRSSLPLLAQSDSAGRFGRTAACRCPVEPGARLGPRDFVMRSWSPPPPLARAPGRHRGPHGAGGASVASPLSATGLPRTYPGVRRTGRPVATNLRSGRRRRC